MSCVWTARSKRRQYISGLAVVVGELLVLFMVATDAMAASYALRIYVLLGVIFCYLLPNFVISLSGKS